MMLIDLVKDIENVEEDSIIFQENIEDPSSDIILAFAEDGGVKEEAGRKFHYLIEVFLAKEFIEDWKASLDYSPSFEEIAKRLFDYAIKDA